MPGKLVLARSLCPQDRRGLHSGSVSYFDRRGGQLIEGDVLGAAYAAVVHCAFCKEDVVAYKDDDGAWGRDERTHILYYPLVDRDVQLVDVYIIQELPF